MYHVLLFKSRRHLCKGSIRRNKEIKGIVVDKEDIKSEIFANDLTSFLRDGASLNALLGTVANAKPQETLG